MTRDPMPDPRPERLPMAVDTPARYHLVPPFPDQDAAARMRRYWDRIFSALLPDRKRPS